MLLSANVALLLLAALSVVTRQNVHTQRHIQYIPLLEVALNF